jgi:hypothetical protein
MLARDIFASFMLDLATKRKSDLQRFFETPEEGGLDRMGLLLVDNGLCDEKEARSLILPALIFRGIVTEK